MSMMIILVGVAALGAVYLIQNGGLSFGGGGGGGEDTTTAPTVPEEKATTPTPTPPANGGVVQMPVQDQGIILVLTQQFGRPPTPREICRSQCKRIDKKLGGKIKCKSDLKGNICFCNCRRTGGFDWPRPDGRRDEWWKRDWRWGNKDWEWKGGKFRKKIVIVTKKPSRWEKLPPKDWNKVENKPGATVTPPSNPTPEGPKTSALVMDELGFTGVV